MLAHDDGSTAEERHAIADALNGLAMLERELTGDRKQPARETDQPRD